MAHSIKKKIHQLIAESQWNNRPIIVYGSSSHVGVLDDIPITPNTKNYDYFVYDSNESQPEASHPTYRIHLFLHNE